MRVSKKLSNNTTWINIDADEITEKSKIYEDYDIDSKIIEYALDENEHAHMDYDREDGTVTFIYSVLESKKDKEYYETVPLTFIVQKNRLLTISNEDNDGVNLLSVNELQKYTLIKVFNFSIILLSFLFHVKIL